MEVKDLPQITQSTESDFAVSSTSQKTRLISFKNIFEKISFSSLATKAKNIIGAINELNTDITHVMMPDYSKQVQVTSPYTAENDGWLQCNLQSKGGLSTLRIDGSTAFAIGQTISSSSYTTNFITVPIAKGQTAVVDGIVASIYFVPCIGI